MCFLQHSNGDHFRGGKQEPDPRYPTDLQLVFGPITSQCDMMSLRYAMQDGGRRQTLHVYTPENKEFKAMPNNLRMGYAVFRRKSDKEEVLRLRSIEIRKGGAEGEVLGKVDVKRFDAEFFEVKEGKFNQDQEYPAAPIKAAEVKRWTVPELGRYVAEVSEIKTPSDFTIRIKKNKRDSIQMSKEMGVNCKKLKGMIREKVDIKKLQEGDFCYRVEVLKREDTKHRTVFKVDVGDEVKVIEDQLSEVEEKFRKVEVGAVKCGLEVMPKTEDGQVWRSVTSEVRLFQLRI